uniref:Uncharacterized protein n=1 Tax=Anguilla anguilla TaxID=7936 RepID=A0A0E9PEQ8_ANGAN
MSFCPVAVRTVRVCEITLLESLIALIQ